MGGGGGITRKLEEGKEKMDKKLEEMQEKMDSKIVTMEKRMMTKIMEDLRKSHGEENTKEQTKIWKTELINNMKKL